ncbi:DUF427 domain-containing protein [Altererythrobacter lutimaris]|uniref:DUF427 domain-containing protein n=1 Tax=Altererythrobacter lutimaris TaxID=2743979 RepID=A0A850HFL4_9SPHN|nr:DUF427 domain-containing protein [Altererythrobacter lutimaris]NVE95858.1 DUF427 domain-containing protein [Altererythrobacter lutimaris]
MRQPHHPEPDPVQPRQESVWDYPRPAIAEPTDRRIQIIHRGTMLVDSKRAWRTLETSHPPTYYIPRSDIAMEHLTRNPRRSLCEWKGQASYWDIELSGERIEAAAWSYEQPTPAFEPIAGYLAFYPEPFDQCLVDGEQITPQPGSFYGGWISQYEAGPFKGIPGSRFW